jgi:type I restriction enzyme S subunit
MEVKPGYKRTDAGVVPEDWQATTIGEVCKTSSGTTPARSLHDRYYRGGDTHWVKTLDLNNSEIITTDERVTPAALDETSLKVYPAGTVLIAMYGGFLQIGRTGILRVPAAVNQAITAVQSKSDVMLPEFLIALLNYRVSYWKAVASSSRKDPNITSRDIKAFPVAYPSVSEQRAIATALGDVDALLASLDQLVTKKRDLKQAAMQQLLTGQTRLPGFDGEWSRVRAGEVGTFRGGSGFPTNLQGATSGDHPFFKVSDMNHEDNAVFMVTANNWITESVRRRIGATCFPEGSIVFAKVGAAVFLERKKILQRPSCLDNNMAGFMSVCDRVDVRFLHFAFLNTKLSSFVSTTALPSLNGTVLAQVELLLPPLEEQVAIAGVLSDMNAEIAALEERRDKTKLLKEGMMQELLTGRTRLV